jgi:hypothetical protein
MRLRFAVSGRAPNAETNGGDGATNDDAATSNETGTEVATGN